MQRFGKPIWVKTKRETILSKGKVYLEQVEGRDTVYNFISESYTNPNDKTILLTIIGKANAERALDWYQTGKRLRDNVVDLSYFDSREDKEEMKNDNLTNYGCLFIFFVFLFLVGMVLITLSGGSEPWQRWFCKIYVILNMSVLHIAVVAGINDSLKNPEKKTYKVKGIRYKIDKIDRIIGTTFGMGLWILIFVLDVWSIVSGNEAWSVWHVLRQLITIPIAVLGACCVIISLEQKANIEERENDD